MEYLLEMRNISKRFPGVLALDDVHLRVQSGEVHALLGENGAGKSTLMKILSGQYSEYDGKIIIDGEEVHFSGPSGAHKAGISIVAQELQSLPDLSVAQNIFIGREPKNRLGMLDWKRLYTDAASAMRIMNLTFDPKQRMSELSVAQKQMLEIIKAITMNSRIIVLDEPTSALTDSESEMLFEKMRELRDNGITFIYISHKIKEIHAICDRMTILRDGRYIGDYDVASSTEADIISKMVGRELSDIYPKKTSKIGDTVLEVEHLTCNGKFRDVSFNVRAGEILGVAGMMGAGRTEVMSALFGLLKSDGGRIILDGREINIRNCRKAISNGIVMVSEDRQGLGLVTEQPINDNIALPNMDMYALRAAVVDKKRADADAQSICSKLELKAPTLRTAVQNLSGGNQQKVVLAKWLVRNIKVLIMDEPTRGIDVGAKHEIYKIILELAASGMAIIMVSSEMPEVLGMSDRILVMADGEIKGECVNSGVTQEQIMSMIVGGNKHEQK